MCITKEKSRKLSTRQLADVRTASGLSSTKPHPASAEQIAERFCDEMIKNLKRNVVENKQRLVL